ncbi:MAG: PepSY-like domain-containing protein [Gemmataceae bacterium]
MRPLTMVASTVILACWIGNIRADEEKVPLDKLPKAVAETVKKRFPKAEQIEASKETENGKTEYEVTIKDSGKKIDVTVAPDGTLLGIEKEIAVKDLPKSVTAGIESKYSKATLKSAEEVMKVKDGKEKLEYYEVIIETADKKTLEIEIQADGKIKKTQEKTNKKD